MRLPVSDFNRLPQDSKRVFKGLQVSNKKSHMVSCTMRSLTKSCLAWVFWTCPKFGLHISVEVFAEVIWSPRTGEVVESLMYKNWMRYTKTSLKTSQDWHRLLQTHGPRKQVPCSNHKSHTSSLVQLVLDIPTTYYSQLCKTACDIKSHMTSLIVYAKKLLMYETLYVD